MIVYLDTSALVPLLVSEPGTTTSRDLWDNADQVVTVRLTFVEATAALARALRLERVSASAYESALLSLDTLWSELTVIEVDEHLMRAAARSATDHDLRGYDAVQCAAAQGASGSEFVAATGDRALLAAWTANGITTVDASLSSS